MRNALPETDVRFLDVLTRLNGGAYPALSFATDLNGANEAWSITDTTALVAALDLAYPNDYLLAETWERLQRVFAFIDGLNAGAAVVKTFAAPAMTSTHARTLKDLMRAKLGAETWLVVSGEIQDVLREGKRTALAAYLLTRPKPADAPTGKWENTNDLYAYYLLDVEMCACQLTSRLVQASGSVQLFVQRCFLGLEPKIAVEADGPTGDSAWRWWSWMSKYRVWEANRKVFLWPENWIEPELKKDRSTFFKELETELLQNEINKDTVETAFTSYLEKLDGVAQLEIAGLLSRGRRRQRDPARVRPHQGRRPASLLLPPLRLSPVDAVGEGRPRHPGRLPDPGGDQQAAVPVLAGVHGSAGREGEQRRQDAERQVRT